jgi:hypothetical protein
MRVLGALAAFAAFGISAGANAADAPKVAALDACSLIAPADVAAVTGGKIARGERNDSGETNEGGGYSSTCIWIVDGLAKLPETQDAPFGGASFAMLNTIVWPSGSGLAKKYVNDFRDAAKQDLIDATPIPVKAGDDALFWGDGVAVAKGDISFGVSVHVGTDKKAEQAMEEALAQKIVPKL